MTFIQDEKFGWSKENLQGFSLFYKGNKDVARDLADFFISHPEDTEGLNQRFGEINRYTSGVLETDHYLIAWVDHIRSWPLFYTRQGDNLFISSNAYEVKNKIEGASYDKGSLLEFKLSGYVTGTDTLIKGLKSLNPGEYLIWNKLDKVLSVHRYFSYIPTFDSGMSGQKAIATQNQIFDDLTSRIIEEAGERTIWIPLSGGLDSRILLCKLHEHGYTNIETFTYGPRFNFEGLVAKKVAKTLGVPWRFVSVPRKTLKKYFSDDNRKEFFKFSGNLKAVPCMREYSAIRYLHETEQIDRDAIFLNGQSGDYITGGHLSEASKKNKNYNKDTLYKVLIDKHYDLLKQYKTQENLSLIKEKIDRFIKSITSQNIVIDTPIDGARYEEVWEYEGRQICYVVNGQRVYEYYGYDWEMPLWEKALVDFYQPVSFDMKYGQKIYKDYLQSYNYMGLFPEKEPHIWRWPLPMMWVVPAAQIVGLFGGRQLKDKFYAVMRYFGHYKNQYAFFSFRDHLKTVNKARNIISLYVSTWLEEHNIKP